MSMIHHGGESYDVAVGKAAANFKRKLEEMIHASVPRVEKVIAQVQNDVPQDALVPANKFAFRAWDGAGAELPVEVVYGEERHQIHKHALGQFAQRADIRNFSTFINELIVKGPWGAKLVAENLNQIYEHLPAKNRFLARAVRGQVRGVLSDSYKRMDTRPLLDSFIGAIQKYGARPVDGFALDTKERVRAILPYIFEPFPGEFLAFGAELNNSNYGDGAFTFSQFVMRAWCTNYAISEDVLHKVHLGAKLPDNLMFSQRTLNLQTDAMASAIKDVAGNVLGPAPINNYLGLVRRANEEKVEAGAINAWVKKNLTKEEGEKVKETFASAEIEKLPAGQTKWRFSNAVSWLANEIEDEHRKLDLQDLAGKILEAKEEKKAA